MFRWFRYFGLVVSVVTVVSFRWFRFGVSGFSTCHDLQLGLNAVSTLKTSQMTMSVLSISFNYMVTA